MEAATHLRKENSNVTLKSEILKVAGKPLPWVKTNSAILIIHGIGNQLPLETLDQFGRGIIKQYRDEIIEKFFSDGKLSKTNKAINAMLLDRYSFSHQLEPKEADGGSQTWFDNVVRITKKKELDGTPITEPVYLDVYEYYWANYTEDKASTSDIEKWISGVVQGSSSFYSMKENAWMGRKYHDQSPLFNKSGKLNVFRYKLLLGFILWILPIFQFFIRLIYRLISKIPVIGDGVEPVLADYVTQKENDFDNIIGDIVVYNVTDPKSKYYCVKRQILDGAVSALSYLLTKKCPPTGADPSLPLYQSVFVAGHSLGTQVGYDAINKINLLVNEGNFDEYDASGNYNNSNASYKNKTLKDQLRGFITFGSPLDKIAFFLREIIPDNEYLRQQLLDDYHGFKQANWTSNNNDGEFVSIATNLKRLLDSIRWKNYYDKHDYVSGSLDFYIGLENVNCQFTAGRYSFTHSYYWDCDDFFKDMIFSFF